MAERERDGRLFWTRSSLTTTLWMNVISLVVGMIAAVVSTVTNYAMNSVDSNSVSILSCSTSGIVCLPCLLIPVTSVLMLASVRELRRMRWMAVLGGLAFPASLCVIALGGAGVVAVAIVEPSAMTSIAAIIITLVVAAAVGLTINQVGLTLFIWRLSSPTTKAVALVLDCLLLFPCAVVTVAGILIGWLSYDLGMMPSDGGGGDDYGFFFALLFIIILVAVVWVMYAALSMLQNATQAVKAYLASRGLRDLTDDATE